MFIFLLCNLQFFLHFLFTFMENPFKKHPISTNIHVWIGKIPRGWLQNRLTFDLRPHIFMIVCPSVHESDKMLVFGRWWCQKEHPGTLFKNTQTYTRTRTHSHMNALTRTYKINKIAESRWRAIAKPTHMHTQTHQHKHKRVAEITDKRRLHFPIWYKKGEERKREN